MASCNCCPPTYPAFPSQLPWIDLAPGHRSRGSLRGIWMALAPGCCHGVDLFTVHQPTAFKQCTAHFGCHISVSVIIQRTHFHWVFWKISTVAAHKQQKVASNCKKKKKVLSASCTDQKKMCFIIRSTLYMLVFINDTHHTINNTTKHFHEIKQEIMFMRNNKKKHSCVLGSSWKTYCTSQNSFGFWCLGQLFSSAAAAAGRTTDFNETTCGICQWHFNCPIINVQEEWVHGLLDATKVQNFDKITHPSL